MTSGPFYVREKMPKHAKPEECRRKVKRVAGFFSQSFLADINGELCRQYASQSTTPLMARGDLEVLRAAINYHRQ